MSSMLTIIRNKPASALSYLIAKTEWKWKVRSNNMGYGSTEMQVHILKQMKLQEKENREHFKTR